MFLGLKVRIAVKFASHKKIEVYNSQISSNGEDMYNFKSYKKKYPQIFSKGLDINLAKKIAKERMGYGNLKSKQELIRIFGWNSYIKSFFTKIFLTIYNIKYQFKKDNT